MLGVIVLVSPFPLMLPIIYTSHFNDTLSSPPAPT